MAKPKPQVDKITFSIKLDPTTRQELKLVALANGMDSAPYVEALIRKHLNNKRESINKHMLTLQELQDDDKSTPFEVD